LTYNLADLKVASDTLYTDGKFSRGFKMDAIGHHAILLEIIQVCFFKKKHAIGLLQLWEICLIRKYYEIFLHKRRIEYIQITII
jgi:hypothetical protein